MIARISLLVLALLTLPSSDRLLVKTFTRPFTPDRHEALGPDDLPMARYRADGVIVPLAPAQQER